jgi:hypothetical protein
VPRFTRRLLLLLIMLSAALAGAPAQAAQPSGLTLRARPAYEGAFRVGTWLPVLVEIENAGGDRRVQVRVGAREGAQYTTELDLPNNGRKSVTIYVYMSPAARRLVVRLVADEQELASQLLQLTPANQHARIIGLLSGPGAAPRPPARLPDGTSLLSVALTPADLPAHALGLSGLDALVIEDVATAELGADQRAALADWVLRGGHLVLGGGAELARTLAGLPPALQLATVSAVEAVPPAALLAAATPDAAALPVARLSPQPDPLGRIPYVVPLAALRFDGSPAIEQSLGRGTVTVVAMPLGHSTIVAWERAPQLWADLLRPAADLPPGFAPNTATIDSFIEGNLAATLTSLPALEFPPMGLLMGLVATYIILVGPVTFLVLRRLDRQALGWVLVPALTLLFAALTYGLGYAQRGGDVVLNQVALIEPAEHGLARVRSFVGIFSPERRDYTLRVADSADERAIPLLRPISVQGPWDGAGINASGLYLQDIAPGAQARNFAVPQWAMRAVANDSIVALGPIRASLHHAGERLLGEVRNESTLTLHDVALIQGGRVARLGDMAPGTTLSGELGQPRGGQFDAFGPGMPLSYLLYSEEMDRQNRMGGQPLSPELQQRVRIIDALFSYGPVSRGGQPLLLAWADTAVLEVEADVTRIDQQRLALVMLTPQLTLDQGELQLDQGWLEPSFETGVNSVCFGASAGVSVGAQPAGLQLRLPRDLYGLRPSELTLITSTDGPWLSTTLVELYDWSSGAWQAQETSARRLKVPEPERYLSSHGMLRVRVSGPADQGGFNCVYVDAAVTGALP